MVVPFARTDKTSFKKINSFKYEARKCYTLFQFADKRQVFRTRNSEMYQRYYVTSYMTSFYY